MSDFLSWGRYPQVSQTPLYVDWLFDLPDMSGDESYLPYGQGRSYGDVCLNSTGKILCTQRLDRFMSFDPEKGILRCESGVTLEKILRFAVPRGWFLEVTPGTQFVSVGGAIANDVHGKNHHRAGTFGRSVLQFCLLRSDGEQFLCSAANNKAEYCATIAGLGLTGLILWADIQLKRVKSPVIEMESIKFSNLNEFFEISGSSDLNFEYTVAWLDCVASGDNFGRGIFMRGNHADSAGDIRGRDFNISVPFDLPDFALNNFSVRAFNWLYYQKQRAKVLRKRLHYRPFFYPLDAVLNWNRIYGKRGFLQFQCVLPKEGDNAPIWAILKEIVKSGQASFLAVLKEFGDIESPGLLSFPRKGVTLCLDFAFRGEQTLRLFERLDQMVREAKGAIYPAKDATMSSTSYEQYYPKLKEFEKYVDPKFSSAFWRRVRGV